MPRIKAPLFLAREVYRKRRLRDAARFLPVLGIVLLMLPKLWRAPDGAGLGAGQDVVYIFIVWAGLIAAAAWLSSGLDASDTPAVEQAEGDTTPPGDIR